jgi:tryptophanyl-tRNA synthetase
MKNPAPRILTGHRPTGPRHIGHLVGTLQNWVKMQDTHQCFFLVADIHVLTTDFENPARISENTLEMVYDWLASGIDPARSTLVLQSAVPEHPILCLLLSMLVSVGRLERIPTYRDQVHELSLNPSLGLLAYPVLQSADILVYRANAVPVGEDQLPHLELTREIAHRFNQLYGEYFPEPEALLSTYPRLPGIDNRTMHTSYNNAIYLRDTPEETTRKVMRMYTDPTRIHATDPGHVHDNPVFTYLDIFDPDRKRVAELKDLYQKGEIGDVEVKGYLADTLNTAMAEHRQRRVQFAAHPQDVLDILQSGSNRARIVARETLEIVMEKMGLRTGLSLSETFTQQQVAFLNGPGC